ncbi:MAG: hypothetical protein FH751_14140 [Firmicutes bacterium]|nr:hypothetical protein [Bacillota bacterium]
MKLRILKIGVIIIIIVSIIFMLNSSKEVKISYLLRNSLDQNLCFDKLSIRIVKLNSDTLVTKRLEIEDEKSIKRILDLICKYKIKKTFQSEYVARTNIIYKLDFIYKEISNSISIRIIGNEYFGLSIGDKDEQVYKLVTDEKELRYLFNTFKKHTK